MVGGILLSNVIHLSRAMSVTTFFIVTACVALFFLLFTYVRRNGPTYEVCSKIPQVSYSLPYIGPVYWYYKAYKYGIWPTWEQMLRLYPKYAYMWLFSDLFVIVSSPQDIESVILSENAIDKAEIYSFFGSKSEGIFIAEGENWRKLRSLLNPSFHTKLLVQFVQVMANKADSLMKILDSEIDKTINFSEYAGRFTLDVICSTQMGVKTYELENNTYNFLHCVDKTNNLILLRMFSPFLYTDSIFKRSNTYKQIQGLCKTIHNFAKMIIVKRKEYLEGQQMHLAKETKEQIYLDGVFSFFSDANERSLIRKVTDVLIAGSDTTRVVTSYTVLFLGMYPEVQEKVYKEQCDIIATYGSATTISNLARMKYLEMVIKESLRLYTTPGIVRKLAKPVTLEDGVTLPTGCSVYVSMFRMHRNPDLWSHPEEFHPDHFLPENVAARPKYSFIPFSLGPRNCPGMTFAYLSMKTVISQLVRNFRIHSDMKFEKFKHKMCLMLELEQGWHISLSRR